VGKEVENKTMNMSMTLAVMNNKGHNNGNKSVIVMREEKES